MRDIPKFCFTYIFVLNDNFDDTIKTIYRGDKVNPNLLDAIEYLPVAREIAERRTKKSVSAVYIKKWYKSPKHRRIIWAWDDVIGAAPRAGWGWAYREHRNTEEVLEIQDSPYVIRGVKSGRKFESWTLAEMVADIEFLSKLTQEKYEQV